MTNGDDARYLCLEVAVKNSAAADEVCSKSSSSDWTKCGNEVSTGSGCRMLLNAEGKAKVNLKI